MLRLKTEQIVRNINQLIYICNKYNTHIFKLLTRFNWETLTLVVRIFSWYINHCDSNSFTSQLTDFGWILALPKPSASILGGLKNKNLGNLINIVNDRSSALGASFKTKLLGWRLYRLGCLWKKTNKINK